MDDASLKALLAEDGLPERDLAFTYAVMQRVAARRAARDILGLVPAAIAAAAALWALVPSLSALLVEMRLDVLGPAGVIIALTLGASWTLGRLRPKQA